MNPLTKTILDVQRYCSTDRMDVVHKFEACVRQLAKPIIVPKLFRSSLKPLAKGERRKK